MKICFIPGFACRAEIFQPVLADFANPWCVDWLPAEIQDVTTMDQLCRRTAEKYESDLAESDVLVGHSLGGGVAFELSSLPMFKNKKVVLVDYFLTTPPAFFRNYCSQESPQAVHDRVKAMLDANRPFFDRRILETTGEYSLARLRERERKSGTKLMALYGMRSERDREKVEQSLELSAEIRSMLEIAFVPGAAHFPMLEQPKVFSEILAHMIQR